MKKFLFLSIALFALSACAQKQTPIPPPSNSQNMNEKIEKTNDDWKKELNAEEYNVLREQGTERAFTGEFWDHHEKGIYTCAACATPLFESETKFESGTGWPSYFKPVDDSCVAETRDVTYGMVRREVHCAKCGGHLGHVFEDGPKPTGLRYCVNSVSLNFVPKSEE